MRRNDFRFFSAGLFVVGLLLMMTTPAILAQGSSPEVQKAYAHINRNAKLEADISKMAMKNSQNADIKKFAHQISSESNSIESELFTYAERDNYQLRGDPPAEALEAQKKMKSVTGTDFDKLYLTQMASMVKDDLQAVQDAGTPKSGTELSAVCAKVQSQSDDRMKQITQLATGENFIIQ